MKKEDVQAAGIYQKDEGWYLYPQAKTTEGVWIAISPALFLPQNVSDEVLGNAILETLAHSHGIVPHPKKWNIFETVMGPLLGKKKWKGFAMNAKYVDVNCDDKELTFTPCIRRLPEKGFGELSAKIISISNSSVPSKIAVTLKKAFEMCENK